MPLVYNGALIGCVDGAWTAKMLAVASDVVGGRVIDPYTHPGGVKEVKPGCQVGDTTLRNLVEVSIGLHGIRRVVLCNHWNCGAYGGSRAFASAEEERAQHLRHLQKRTEAARDFLQRHVEEILRTPESFPRVNFERALGNLQRVVDEGLDIHSILLLPPDLEQPFSGDPEDCVPFHL